MHDKNRQLRHKGTHQPPHYRLQNPKRYQRSWRQHLQSLFCFAVLVVASSPNQILCAASTLQTRVLPFPLPFLHASTFPARTESHRVIQSVNLSRRRCFDGRERPAGAAPSPAQRRRGASGGGSAFLCDYRDFTYFCFHQLRLGLFQSRYAVHGFLCACRLHCLQSIICPPPRGHCVVWHAQEMLLVGKESPG